MNVVTEDSSLRVVETDAVPPGKWILIDEDQVVISVGDRVVVFSVQDAYDAYREATGRFPTTGEERQQAFCSAILKSWRN